MPKAACAGKPEAWEGRIPQPCVKKAANFRRSQRARPETKTICKASRSFRRAIVRTGLHQRTLARYNKFKRDFDLNTWLFKGG